MEPKLAPVLVTDEQGLQLVADFLSRSTLFGLDCEWNVTDDFYERTVRTIQVGDRNEQYVIDLLPFAGSESALVASQGNYGAAAELLLGPVINTLKPYLENHEVTKVGINLQADYQVLCWGLGIRTTGFWDCQRAEQSIYMGLVHFMAKKFWALEDLVRRYVGMELQDLQTGKTFDLCTPLTEQQILYGGLDCRLPLAIRAGQLKLIHEHKLEAPVQIDCDAISPFGDMYLAGFGMDDDAWLALYNTNLDRKRRIVAKMDDIFIPVVGTKFVSDTDNVQLAALEAEWLDCPQKTPEQKARRKDLRIAFMGFRHRLNERVKGASKCEGGAAINYGAPKQLLAALRKLGFGAKKLPNTDDKSFEKLAKYPNLDVEKAFIDDGGELNYPIIDLLRLYRSVDKLVDTYGEAWLKTEDQKGHRNRHTNRIHSEINLLGAVTGRTSSSNPNIQNLPKSNEYRHCFVARPGYKIITVDYSGAELRILAYMSQEPVWLEAFAKGWDVHSVGAEMLYGQRWIDAAEPGCAYYEKHDKCHCREHKKLRNHIKSVNFGLAYGLQAKGLAAKLGITEDEAETLLERYKAAFPTVMKFLDDLGKAAKMHMEARTVTNRRRRWVLPTWELAKFRLQKDPKNKNKVITQDMVRRRYVGMFNSIEREGKNMPIQGANADLTKRAMFLIWQRLFIDFKAFFVNTVHDEVVIECPEESADTCCEFIGSCMRAAGAEWIKGIVMEVEGAPDKWWTK